MKKKLTHVSDLKIEFCLLDDGLTQSLFCAYGDCPRKFLYKICRIRNKSTNYNTLFGEISHQVLDKVYSLKNTDPDLIDKEIDRVIDEEAETLDNEVEMIGAKAFAVLLEYVDYYKDDFKENKYGKPEEIFNIDSGEDGIYCRRRGKIDGQFRAKGTKDRWLLERKTKGQINLDSLMSYLSMDFQSLYYILAKENKSKRKYVGVLYDVIRNPGTKQKQGEDLWDYIDRLRETIKSKPDYYFMRIEIPYSKKEKEDFNEELKRKVKDIFFKLEACKKFDPYKVFYRNQSSCIGKFTCSYIDACTTGSLRNYYQKDKLFNELEE